MPLPFLVLSMLAAAAPASAGPPINVVGHAWAPFISPMGEPFRAHSPTDDTLANWFRQADRNHDGLLTADEMQADAERYFRMLDTDHDDQIDPDELAHYEYDVAPEIQVMSRTRPSPGQPPSTAKQAQTPDENSRTERRRRETEEAASLGLGSALQGAARYSLLDIPQPVAAADTDFNRAITLDEFKAAAISRFQLLDSAHAGTLTLQQLEALRAAELGESRHGKPKGNTPDKRIGNPLPAGG